MPYYFTASVLLLIFDCKIQVALFFGWGVNYKNFVPENFSCFSGLLFQLMLDVCMQIFIGLVPLVPGPCVGCYTVGCGAALPACLMQAVHYFHEEAQQGLQEHEVSIP